MDGRGKASSPASKGASPTVASLDKSGRGEKLFVYLAISITSCSKRRPLGRKGVGPGSRLLRKSCAKRCRMQILISGEVWPSATHGQPKIKAIFSG